ncbi:DEAD/DEAH box helicase [Streptomyces sp. FZ201]|uniref:DEAD/DEAH box helicase n=1 Tax=Streptomyces sp. FZ201 TaxID=3057122 RepID=UPI0021BFEFBB|nr:DEAD/DEAH box helicase [Streptomyces sp. FZ201]
MHSLDPLATSLLISDTYRRYLRSLLPLREPRLAEALAQAVDTSPLLTKGPLLEATPAYAQGATLDELIAEGVLDPAFRALTGPALPADRPLYRHQEQALRKAVAGRNLVVATGTGSGKTESFLLPVLNALAAEHARGTLGPGVRALLLYPMNALANDQMKRLRRLLAAAPHLTFGRYTGDTHDDPRRAADTFEQLNPGEPRLPNELLSRREMRATPPHILLTNYAMLEYLLLRPQDMDLFEGEHAGGWRYIVVDEAHVYDGARGAELAMLLRRLKDRVGKGRAVQAIATSATVGAEENPAAVTAFAQALFDVPFHWDADDPAEQDLVTATRVAAPEGPHWGPLPTDRYLRLVTEVDPGPGLVAAAREHGLPAGVTPAAALATEAGTAALRRALAEGPRPVHEIAESVFPGDPAGPDAVAALIQLASRVTDTDGAPVLSARYHVFARATEGAFTCLDPAGPHLDLARHESCATCARPSFELGACRRCGAVHLHGTLDGAGGRPRLAHRKSPDKPHTWLLLDGGDLGAGVDEDDETLGESTKGGLSERRLCTRCAAVHPAGTPVCTADGCQGSELRRVHQLDTRDGTPASCLSCGARGHGMIRLFETGNEAAASVLGTALYQALPPATEGPAAALPGKGRKLLFFSDSRQAAAYFAPYLEDSYTRIQHRRLMTQAALKGCPDPEEPLHIDDLVAHTVRAADRAGVFRRNDSRQAKQREVALWVMQEVLSIDDRQSLEGLGLLRVDLDREHYWQPPAALTSLGLTEDESWRLLQELLRTVRNQGALTMPEDVDAGDEAFAPRRGPVWVRSQGSDADRKVISWLPSAASVSNRRVDYLERVLDALGHRGDRRATALETLRRLWTDLTTGHLAEWLAGENQPGIGAVRRLDHAWLRLRPVTADTEPVHVCDRCRRVVAVSVRGVCPTLRCTGRLEEYKPSSESDSHLRRLYLTFDPVPLKAQEHTAQWTGEKAAEVQGEFVRGQVNALSCSTTFELGVDVGELQAVVLRNMPPSTANYVQRAGRAGRRADSAALVLTYAQRRPHDLARFAEPQRMIAGEVRAPIVPVDNVRIDRRHAHSIALAAFFRAMKEERGRIWRTAGEFFLPDDTTGEIAAHTVRDWLTPVPESVTASVRRVLPQSVQDEIGVESDAWVGELDRLLRAAQQILEQDVTAYTERRDQAAAARKYRLAEMYQKVIHTLTKRDLLGVLANRNVLPKYGFPVDTVELRLPQDGGAVAGQLELTRDLSAAVHEYAPGAEIVAGGRLWSSAGVYRLPDRELVSRYYTVCGACGRYAEATEPVDPTCTACGTVSTAAPRRYVEPVYGFVAARGPQRRPGQTPPRRSWYGDVHMSTDTADLTDGVTVFPSGHTTAWSAGARGEMVVVSEGPAGAGYEICDWCGWGRPHARATGRRGGHPHLLKDTPCTGPLRVVSLAHRYQTDFLQIHLDPLTALSAPPQQLRSGLYALLEGAATHLEISRDDIDGTVHTGTDGMPSLLLFDTTPGGAGNVIRVGDRLAEVVDAALSRVGGCECGPESSCYACLRTFRNERFHELLSRQEAVALLGALAGGV